MAIYKQATRPMMCGVIEADRFIPRKKSKGTMPVENWYLTRDITYQDVCPECRSLLIENDAGDVISCTGCSAIWQLRTSRFKKVA